MKYMILIHSSQATETALAAGLDEELGAVHGAIIDELRASGEFIDTSEFDMRAEKIVRTGDGLSVTDGPFAETTEWIGGYYLVDCVSMDRVVEITARFVEARYAAVEVRALVEYAG
jgi:hypothetical protein